VKNQGNIWQQIEILTGKFNKGAGQVLNVNEFNQIAITSHSTRIEGSTLTLNESVTLIEKGIPAAGRPILHQNMVLDHHEALLFILQAAKYKTPVTISFLQQMASLVMRRTGKKVNSILGDTDEAKGDFRMVNVSAGGHFFVGYDKVKSLTEKLVLKIQNEIDNVKSAEEIHRLSFIVHFDLVSIHPFTDGNGRTSRLLMNYIQAYHNQPLTVVQAESKTAYIESLDESRKKQSTEPITMFLAQQHLSWLNKLEQDFQNSLKSEVKGNLNKGLGYSIFY
jgi:Fic family protein